MNNAKIIRSYCTQRIAPVAMALTFALTGGAAFASTAGQNAIAAKLTPAFIPSLKVAATVTKAKPADLLLALAFALEDSANSALTADEIAAGALEAVAGKSRADKDKIAGQIIATVAASRTLTTAQLGAVLKNVYSVNTVLKPAGKALAVAAALKSAGAAANGNDLGAALATVPGISAELSLLLQNTSKALGTGTYAASGQLKNFVNGLSNSVAAAGREAIIKDAAEKVAAANATAAGAFYGGLVLNHPAGAYSDNASLKTLALGIIADAKLGKAIGEILGNTLGGHTGRETLDTDLITATTPVPVKSLIYQGILRAGTEANVAGVLDTAALTGITDRAAFAGVVSTGNGADSLKLSAIVKAVADGQDSATKTKIGISVISAVAVNTPAAAGAATAALFDSAGASFSNDTLRLAFGTAAATALKSKGFAAVGSMAATVADRNSTSTLAALAGVATSIMAKAPKAATDIAQQISALSASKITDPVAFAKQIADSNKTFVLNAAVGVSITSPALAGKITAAAITHSPTLDTKALGAAAKIAGAVALAVDEERAADVALELGDLMSDPKALLAGKPIKLSSAVAVATALAKALQAKQGVSTTNTMDEIGETASNLIASILGKSLGKDAAAKAKAETKLVTAVGSAFLKALSTKPTLNGEYGTDAKLRLYASKATLKADQTEAQDIVGSIAQTILSYYTAQNSVATGTALIAPGSALEKAFLKLSGKKGSADLAAATTAFNDVRGGLNSPATRFEDGTKAKINGSVNDKETDTRNL